MPLGLSRRRRRRTIGASPGMVFAALALVASDALHSSPAVSSRQSLHFERHDLTSALDACTAVAIADVDGDQLPDVVAAFKDADTIAWWRNEGGGHFSQVTVDDGFGHASAVTVADMDHVGDLDIVAGGNEGVAWWENRPGATYVAHPIDDRTFRSVNSLGAADFNSDGRTDVAALGIFDPGGHGEVLRYLAQGDGSFAQRVVYRDNQRFVTVGALAVARIDDDGDYDLVTNCADYLRWWENDGTGEFTPHSVEQGLGPGTSVEAPDLDRDGDADLLASMTPGGSSARVKWWRNEDEVFTPMVVVPNRSIDGVQSACAADIDGLHGTDVVVGAWTSKAVAVMLEDGAKGFSRFDVATTFGRVWAVADADLDDDGDTDIVAASLDQGLAWWENVPVPAASPTATMSPGDTATPTGTARATRSATPSPTVRATASPAPGCSRPRWTVLAYLAGDNNLDLHVKRLFQNLEIAASNPCLGIVALWDRPQSSAVLYDVLPDADALRLAPYAEGVNKWDWGEVDMGDGTTLVRFVRDALRDRNGTQVLLAIVGHGNGWSPAFEPANPERYTHGGIGADDSSGGSYIGTEALAGALQEVADTRGQPVDVLFLDACLMGMMENAYPLRDAVRYLVASENQTFTSYPYERYLSGVTDDTDARGLATTIVREYDGSLREWPRTMAALDISAMTGLAALVDRLADALIADLAQNLQVVQSAFQASQRFDSRLDGTIDVRDNFVDLYDVARLVHDASSDERVREAAAALRDAASPDAPLVVAEEHRSGNNPGTSAFWHLDNSHGLSIYLPLGSPDRLLGHYQDAELAFAADTSWDDMIREIVKVLPPTGDLPPQPAPADRPGPLFATAAYLYLPSAGAPAPP